MRFIIRKHSAFIDRADIFTVCLNSWKLSIFFQKSMFLKSFKCLFLLPVIMEISLLTFCLKQCWMSTSLLCHYFLFELNVLSILVVTAFKWCGFNYSLQYFVWDSVPAVHGVWTRMVLTKGSFLIIDLGNWLYTAFLFRYFLTSFFFFFTMHGILVYTFKKWWLLPKSAIGYGYHAYH